MAPHMRRILEGHQILFLNLFYHLTQLNLFELLPTSEPPSTSCKFICSMYSSRWKESSLHLINKYSSSPTRPRYHAGSCFKKLNVENSSSLPPKPTLNPSHFSLLPGQGQQDSSEWPLSLPGWPGWFHLLLSRPSPHCNLALFFIILLSHKLLQWSPFIMMKIKIPESNLQPSLLLFNSMNCLSHWLWFSPISYLSLLQLSSLSWILSHANSIPDMMGSFFSFLISLNVISSVSPSQILVNIHFLHSSVIIFGDTFVSWSPVSL